MYKTSNFLVTVLLISCAIYCGCSLLKKPLISVEPSLLKANEDVNLLKGEIKELKGDISGLKTNVSGDLSAVKGDISLVKGNIDKLADIQLQLKAQLDTNLKAVAGVNNKIEEVKTTAGRDVVQTTTTTNETKLLIYIFQGLFGLMTLISTWLFKSLKAKDTWLKNLIKSNQEKEQRLDEWQQKMIEKLELNKKI